MLGQLHIKNIGIIEDLYINFQDGFQVLTGETGAGKSLIIGSIAAVTGSRISKEMMKSGSDYSLIEACFFEDEKNLILSREIFANGRNICKIDGKMVPLSTLKEMGENLIDIHGQHDNQSLLNPAMHLDLLDRFIGEKMMTAKKEYSLLLAEYKRVKKLLEEEFGDEKDYSRRIDLLEYQIQEIENAHLKIGEEEELNTVRNKLMNAEKIAKSLSNTYYNLNDIVIDNLGMAVHELSGIASLDEKYDQILFNLNESYYSLKDAASETLDCMNEMDFDEQEQNRMEERLDVIFHLKRKYGNDVESVLKYAEERRIELERLQNADERIEEYKKQLAQLEDLLKQKALTMRREREKGSRMICQKVNQELKDLEMKNAKMEYELKPVENFREDGMDEAEIVITTNVGELPKPLHKIASGGEISRMMLALKTVFAQVDTIPSMIFDEIDTGISGQAAKVVAQKMREISKNHQLICITHLPMIAAFGDTNFQISKKVKEGTTCTEVKKLKEEEVIEEIARMSAGDDITLIGMEQAKELRKLRDISSSE